jgi:hypothetical protein
LDAGRRICTLHFHLKGTQRRRCATPICLYTEFDAIFLRAEAADRLRQISFASYSRSFLFESVCETSTANLGSSRDACLRHSLPPCGRHVCSLIDYDAKGKYESRTLPRQQLCPASLRSSNAVLPTIWEAATLLTHSTRKICPSSSHSVGLSIRRGSTRETCVPQTFAVLQHSSVLYSSLLA